MAAVVTDRQHLLAVARGDEPADLVVRDARVFSVFTREWLEGDVAVADGRFAGVGSYEGKETLDARGSMLVPGFIDAHVHIESSMLTLERFAEVVLASGHDDHRRRPARAGQRRRRARACTGSSTRPSTSR